MKAPLLEIIVEINPTVFLYGQIVFKPSNIMGLFCPNKKQKRDLFHFLFHLVLLMSSRYTEFC